MDNTEWAGVGADAITWPISKKEASITAQDASIVYGEADPAFSADEAGVISGETLVYSINRQEGEDTGTYTISVKDDTASSVDANYDITTHDATFTITGVDIASATISGIKSSYTYC